MSIINISVGKFYPDIVNFIVEISMGESHVKYEVDKELGILKVDRILTSPMYYPANYGCIPSTVALDGDPLDALLLSPCPISHGVLVTAKPVGVMRMEDEEGIDDKIILVITDEVNTNDISDVSQSLKDKIEHFFMYYKKLDNNKWSKVQGWHDVSFAKQAIIDAVERGE